jgi:hypothetical protein
VGVIVGGDAGSALGGRRRGLRPTRSTFSCHKQQKVERVKTLMSRA